MRRVCIDVGHTPAKFGAVSVDGITEYEQNIVLSNKLAVELHAIKIIPVIVYRDTYNGLPRLINATNADICISVHANAASDHISGTETLYYEYSQKSRQLASIVQKSMCDCLNLRDRGLRGLDVITDRGYDLVKNTAMPHIIIEPYFVTNQSDLDVANSKMSELAESIAIACETYLFQG